MGDVRRQTFSAQSSHCSVSNTTISIGILDGVLNKPGASYYVSLDDNAVVSKGFDEPLMGISKGIWFFRIGKISPIIYITECTSF